MEPSECRHDTLIEPDPYQFRPRTREKRVALGATPGKRTRVSVDGSDIGRIRTGELRDLRYLPQQVWPGQPAPPITGDEEERLALARPVSVGVVAGRVIDVPRHLPEPVVPCRVAGSQKLNTDGGSPFFRQFLIVSILHHGAGPPSRTIMPTTREWPGMLLARATDPVPDGPPAQAPLFERWARGPALPDGHLRDDEQAR